MSEIRSSKKEANITKNKDQRRVIEFHRCLLKIKNKALCSVLELNNYWF
jgi:hypothetical protein